MLDWMKFKNSVSIHFKLKLEDKLKANDNLDAYPKNIIDQK